ncbi:MAG: M12 family metallopeptidase [Granulosicoccus sp.]
MRINTSHTIYRPFDKEEPQANRDQASIISVLDEFLTRHPTLADAERSGIVKSQAVNPNSDLHWPYGVVPYTFDPSVLEKDKTAMLDGMATISSQTNVIFVELPDINHDGLAEYGPKDYISFSRVSGGVGSYSNLGRVGGKQMVAIHDSHKNNKIVVAHELMHALGFEHAQQHPNSTETIDIRLENVVEGYEHNFILSEGTIVGPYDPDSVMHYRESGLSNGNGPTIVIKPDATLPDGVYLGQRDHLSTGDIASINAVYKKDENSIPNGFDAEYYLEQNTDVADAFGEDNHQGAYIHWYRHGMQEGRAPSLAFDPKYYLEQNPVIAEELGSENYTGAYEHFINIGIHKGSRGSIHFDPKYYIEANPDLGLSVAIPIPGSDNSDVFIKTNYKGALDHWLIEGKDEGRAGSLNSETQT